MDENVKRKGKDFEAVKRGAVGSVLDNKETFVQFPTKNNVSNVRDFTTVYQRIQNLKISKMLSESYISDSDSIRRTMKSLNCCSSIALVGNTEENNKVIKRISKRCRHQLCSSCGRVRANLMRHRLMAWFETDDGKNWLKGKKAYFITLTLRHNDEIRNYVYLNELKGYVRKLILSKVFKKYFPYSKKEGGSGWFVNYEMTQGQNGLHIHSHVLVIADTVSTKVSEVQTQLQEKWVKLSKDSFGVRVDLAGKKKSINSNSATHNLVSEVLEIFKYSVKGSTKFTNNQKAKNELANWVRDTKGKNLITAGGYFRGLGITASKPKKEDIGDDFSERQSTSKSIAIGRTSQIKFNISAARYYTSKYLSTKLDHVFISSLSLDFIELEGIETEVDFLLKLGFNDDEILKGIGSWIAEVKERIEVDEEETYENIPSARQLALFQRQANNFSLTTFIENS